jgi:hypothetical protein
MRKLPAHRFAAAALAALALLTPAGNAAGKKAATPHRPKGPIVLSMRSACGAERVLAFARTHDPSVVRAMQLRLDGEEIGSMSRERPGALAVSVDCAALDAGRHVLSASVRNADGTRAKAQRTFVRLPEPELGVSFQ